MIDGNEGGNFNVPIPPGPPFEEQQAPYPIYPIIPQGELNGTPIPPSFVEDKQFWSAGYPVHMTDSSGLLSRCEPTLTPEKLISRYLKGIPLRFPNGDGYSAEDIKDQIGLAINEIEMACKITLSREQFTDKVPFDISLYKSFIYLKTEQGPVLSVQSVRIVSSDGYAVFEIPSSWLEPSNFSKNIVNVVPILGAYSVSTGGGVGAYGGIPYLNVFSQLTFVPGFWQLVYTTGVSKIEGQLPIPINDLIGTIASINMLNNITTMFLTNSQSQSRDGLSQSSSGPGPRTYINYIENLEKKRDKLMAKVKAAFSSKFLVSNI